MNKMIAIWGNPNSGKTTFSIKLAHALSKHKKNVILVFCDSMVPIISAVMPFKQVKQQSLGEILSAVQITQEQILKKNITLDKNEYLSVMGYLHGENESTYAKYSKESVIDFFILLKHLADYIVIDCSSFITHDILSRAALELSDQVIRLISPDLKAISYYDATLVQIAQRKYNLQNHIKILSNVKANMPADAISNKFGGVSLSLCHLEEIEKQFYEGRLFEPLTLKSSESYQNIVETLANRLMGADEHAKTAKINQLKKWIKSGVRKDA